MVREEGQQLAAGGDGGSGEVDATVGLEVSQVVEVPRPDGRRAADTVRMYAVITVSVRRNAVPAPRPAAVRHAEILLIDHSSSMVIPPSRLAAARAAAEAALGRIPDGALFAVVAGRDRASVLYPRQRSLAVADERSRADAAAALHRCAPGGGTAMGTWLECARELLRDLPPGTADDYRRHVLLLTDGRNESAYESGEELRERVARCATHFVCDPVGIGDAWQTEELLLIADGLGGRAGAVGDLSLLPGELAELAQQAAEHDITGLRLRLHHRADVTLHSFEQVHPTRVALHPAATDLSAVNSGTGGPIEEYTTQPWATETRDYLLCVSAPYRAEQLGKDLFLTEVEVVPGPGRAPRVELPPGEAVMMRWTDDADLYSRVDPRVAHYQHEEDLHRTFEQGCAALRRGDTEAAEARFGDCWALAVSGGDTMMQEHLGRLVEVVGTGTEARGVRLRTVIERFDVESTRLRLSRTVLPDGERGR